MNGRFITFEGGEGVGKSTQLRRLAQTLRARGETVLTTREPGGTPSAEAIRTLVVTGETGRWLPLSEVMLFAAARYEHVERVIRPALALGKWVLCDRFTDSTLAYQGYGLGYDIAAISRLQELVLAGLAPALTFVLDIEAGAGLARSGQSQRYEAMGLDFHCRLRDGFLAVAAANPARCALIDAGQSVEEVETAILDEMQRRFPLSLIGEDVGPERADG